MFLARVAHLHPKPWCLGPTRGFAAISSSSPTPSAGTVGPYHVFDRNAKRLQKDRAVARDGGTRSTTVDYVRDEVADRMMERFLVRQDPIHNKMETLIFIRDVGYQTKV